MNATADPADRVECRCLTDPQLHATCTRIREWRVGGAPCRDIASEIVALALDYLVRFAQKQAYHFQLTVAAPLKRTGARYERHESEAAALAKCAAVAFESCLRAMAGREQAAVKAAAASVLTWWRTRPEPAPPVCGVIRRCAEEIAVALVCSSGCSVGPPRYRAAWILLVESFLHRLIPSDRVIIGTEEALSRCGPGEAVEEQHTRYLTWVYAGLTHRKEPFQYESAGAALKFLKRLCANEAMDKYRELDTSVECVPMPDEEVLESLLADRSEAAWRELDYTPGSQEQDPTRNRSERNRSLLKRLWAAGAKSNGRRRAIVWYVLALMQTDGFDWSEAAGIIDDGDDLETRYEDDLPEGVGWEEARGALAIVAHNGVSLRKFWSRYNKGEMAFAPRKTKLSHVSD